ncbi:MAG: succinate dehydrogenase, cytochrome b556 subunit [Alphaproteobacteria bacterium]
MSTSPHSDRSTPAAPLHPRPLSPHVQIYRWTLLMALSILHRLSGVALAVGAVAFVWWLSSAAVGAAYYDFTHGLLASVAGRVILFGFSLALFYHLANGIRHLAWDAGWGFELPRARLTAWLTLFATLLLTLATWGAGYLLRGA